MNGARASASSSQSDSTEDLPSVSTIVVNRNGSRYLEHCLHSLKHLDYPQNLHEIILVDNASSDGSVELVRAEFPEVKIIQLEKNYGFCFPNNVGADKAAGQYLAFLNNDTEVDKRWLRELVRGLSMDPSIRSVASKILYFDERNRINAAGGKLTILGHGYYEGCGDIDRPQYNRAKFTGFGCGAGVLVERKLFVMTGGFDPAYFAGIEEHDLGWRIWLAGHAVFYAPRAVVYHWESGTFGKRAGYEPIKIFLTTRNRLFNLTKNVQNFAKGLALCIIYDAAQLITFCVERRPIELQYTILAYVQWIKNLKTFLRRRSQIQMQRKRTDRQLVEMGVLAGFGEFLVELLRFRRIREEPHMRSTLGSRGAPAVDRLIRKSSS